MKEGEPFFPVALHCLLEFVVARGAMLVDDRAVPFDGGQLAVDLCNAAIVLCYGALCAPVLLGSACSSSRCSNNTSRITASLASARSVSGSP
jgi:hypothetical protein